MQQGSSMWGLFRNTLSAYYLALMDSIHPICPDCLFLGEGTGATNLAANWGAFTCFSLTCLCHACMRGPLSVVSLQSAQPRESRACA